MSEAAASAVHGHPDAGHHGSHDGHDDHDDGGLHATVGGYATGFILSVILTAIPFWIVMNHSIESPGLTTVVLLGLGAVQIFVHMIYFLHLNTRVEAGWTLMALIFTLVFVVITLSGSLWVMFHLDANMHPVTPEQMRIAP